AIYTRLEYSERSNSYSEISSKELEVNFIEVSAFVASCSKTCVSADRMNKYLTISMSSLTYHVLILFSCILPGFFEDAKSDFQQALKLDANFEDAKMSLQQTLLDQQEKLNRGY
uniref:Uncharacterized protein n=1 Tax=Xiphophorus couchianus TaxID=32473 RepID=A0A3B5KXJ8_9TELE